MAVVLHARVQSPASGLRPLVASSHPVNAAAGTTGVPVHALATKYQEAGKAGGDACGPSNYFSSIAPLKAFDYFGDAWGAGDNAGDGLATTVGGAGLSIFVVCEATANHCPLRRA
jgi:hypothetical protein